MIPDGTRHMSLLAFGQQSKRTEDEEVIDEVLWFTFFFNATRWLQLEVDAVLMPLDVDVVKLGLL